MFFLFLKRHPKGQTADGAARTLSGPAVTSARWLRGDESRRLWKAMLFFVAG